MLSEEDKKVLEQAEKIKERLEAERLEAGETMSTPVIKPVAPKQLPKNSNQEKNSVYSQEITENSPTTPAKRRTTPVTTSGQNLPTTQGKKKKKSGSWKVILITILILLLVLIGVLFGLLFWYVSHTNYEPLTSSFERSSDVMTKKGVTNILFIGTDARTASEDSRSDSMILITINSKSHKVIMTSILRDSYVDIPGYGMNRINHAYQMGGEALLIQTIEQNFKVGIDSYVKVDFFSFINIIDSLGGVPLTISDAEASYVNMYLNEINGLLGLPATDGDLPSGGTFMASGKQALAYARIRYIGTDFARTGRQRTVLLAMLNKAKNSNLVTLYQAGLKIMPDLTTDISDIQMTMLIIRAIFYSHYDIVDYRVPIDGYWWNDTMPNGQEVLNMDMGSTINTLQATLFGE